MGVDKLIMVFELVVKLTQAIARIIGQLKRNRGKDKKVGVSEGNHKRN